MTPGRAVAALVPVRGLAEGKQRLAAVLSAAERRELIIAMLEDVLAALCGCAAVKSVAVVTGDAAVAALAGEHGAAVLPDAAEGGLNGSLAGARAWLRTLHPAASILILAADLPLVTHALLEDRVFAAGAEVVIARSGDGGTNALLLRPPAVLPLSFGPGSCARHRAAAIAAGRSVQVIDDPDLALDLDRPADLAAHLSRAASGRTRHLLRRLRIHERLAGGMPPDPVLRVLP